MSFSGITTALITPFKQGELDKISFFLLLKDQIQQGIYQFVLNGTTGESPCLETQEVETLCSWFKEFEKKGNTKLTMILGTGNNCTASSVEKTKKAIELGADAVLVVTPYYNNPNQEGLFDHFERIAKSTPLPVFLYNVPSRTGISLNFETIKALSLLPNIIGIKEASGDMEFFKQIRSIKNFLVLSGDDFTMLDSFLLGGGGIISVCSHVLGKEIQSLFSEAKKQEDDLLKDFEKYKVFLKELYKDTNPIGIKQILKETGIILSDELRLPLKSPSTISKNLKESFYKLKKPKL